jgi:hypothetical protein
VVSFLLQLFTNYGGNFYELQIRCNASERTILQAIAYYSAANDDTIFDYIINKLYG